MDFDADEAHRIARRYEDALSEDAYASERVEESDEASEGEQESSASARERNRKVLYPPIARLVSALGGFEEKRNADGDIVLEYTVGYQVMGCLRDLKKFWRFDDNDTDRPVLRIFHELGLLENDLIPIIQSQFGTSERGNKLALICAELIGVMIWPIDVAEELREAKQQDRLRSSADYASLVAAHRSFKAAILRTGVLRHFVLMLAPVLSKKRHEMEDRDKNIIGMVLRLLRNIAAVTDKPAGGHSADDVEQSSLQSEFVRQLTDEDMDIAGMLVGFASEAGSHEWRPFNCLILDILHLIFRHVKPTDLVVPRGEAAQSRLEALLDREDRSKLEEKRRANTRHSRFGTTVAVKTADKKSYVLHKQSSIVNGAEKAMDSIKKSKHKKARLEDDLAPPTRLQSSALKRLYSVALNFLDSAFNPFFESILTDIRMEREKVSMSDPMRYMFLVRFFLEFFMLVYRDERSRGVDPKSEEGHSFEQVRQVLDIKAVVFVTGRMKLALDDKPPQWVELHAAVDCFTSVLSVIEMLISSNDDDLLGDADTLQQKLYHDGETLDNIIRIVSGYKTQSKRYLHSIVNMSYVLLQMLEKYLKNHKELTVRRKNNRKQRRQRRAGEEAGDGLAMDDGGDDGGRVSYTERNFDFHKFQQRFADEGVLATFMLYLEGYAQWTSYEDVRRITNLLFRLSVNCKAEALFFKPTTLELFRRMLHDKHSVVGADEERKENEAKRKKKEQRDMAQRRQELKDKAKAEGESVDKDKIEKTVLAEAKARRKVKDEPRDLFKFVDYILKRFFARASDNPLLMMEMFFPKTRSSLGRWHDGEEGSSDEEGGFSIAASAEVEVAPGFSLTQQIGIAVATLLDDDLQDYAEAVVEKLRQVASERHKIVLEVDGEASEPEEDEGDEAIRARAARRNQVSKEAKEKLTPYLVSFDDAELRHASAKNAHLKLLMRLLQWESHIPEGKLEPEWTVPSSLLPATLTSDAKIVANFIADPVDPSSGKRAAELLRKQRKAPKRRRVVRDDDGEEPKKRTRKRKEEESHNYKSAQFIEDSDDDSDDDRAFFEREKELRRQLDVGEVRPMAFAGTKTKKQRDQEAKEDKARAEKANRKPRRSRSASSSSATPPRKKARPSSPAPSSSSLEIEDEQPDNVLRDSSARASSSTLSSPPVTKRAVESDDEAVARPRARRVVADSDDDE